MGQYSTKNFDVALQMVQRAETSDGPALLLQGLCWLRLGKKDKGRKLIKRAYVVDRSLRDYALLEGWMKNAGKSEADIHEATLRTFWNYRVIDAFILSYPKCGRTWLRSILSHYLAPEDDYDTEILKLTLARADSLTVDVSHDDYPHWTPVSRLNQNKNAYKGKRVLFLIRDPRDILVSNFFQYTKRGDRERAGDDFDGDLSAFIRHDIGGLRSIVRYYNTWAENRDVPARFELMTYEDLRTEPNANVSKAVSFLGLPNLGVDRIAESVDYCSFANMQKREKDGKTDDPRFGATKDGDSESLKVRKGQVGGFVDYFSAEDRDYVDRYLNDELNDAYAFYKR